VVIEHTGPLIDHDRTACLCSDGLPGYWAAVCVTASGEDALWLVCVDELDTEHSRHGNGDQPHEQLGPMPATWRHRTALAPLRCARPTKVGRPCRTLVTDPGQPCPRHRAQTTAHDRQAEQ
jgi:hypothetical protein